MIMHTFKAHMRESAREYFCNLLRECNYNIHGAARTAGLNRTHFYALLHKYDIKIPRPGTGGRIAFKNGPASTLWRSEA